MERYEESVKKKERMKNKMVREGGKGEGIWKED